jgi:hypothetical protein
MTRTGKIARLPAALREEINRSLEDGQKSKTILPWLNTLPEVKAVVDADFKGNLITKHNLSEWNTGGYTAWAEGRRLRESVGAFLEDAASFKAVTEGQLTESMGTMLAATMADQMQRLHTMPDGIEKAKIWKELRISLLALRRSELDGLRFKLKAGKHTVQLPQPREEHLTLAQKVKSVMDRIGINEGFDGSINPELTRDPYLSRDQNVGVNRTKMKNIFVLGCRIFRPDHVIEQFLRHNVANTIRRAAATGMFFEIGQVVAVIESNFLAGLNVSQRHNPHAALLADRFAIGRATVIEEARRIPFDVSIQIKLVIEAENKPVLRFATPDRFRLADALADVFDDARAFRNEPRGNPALAMNRRRTDSYFVRLLGDRAQFRVVHAPKSLWNSASLLIPACTSP